MQVYGGEDLGYEAINYSTSCTWNWEKLHSSRVAIATILSKPIHKGNKLCSRITVVYKVSSHADR